MTAELALGPFGGGFLGKELKVSPIMMWVIFGIGAASFVPLMFLQYVRGGCLHNCRPGNVGEQRIFSDDAIWTELRETRPLLVRHSSCERHIGRATYSYCCTVDHRFGDIANRTDLSMAHPQNIQRPPVCGFWRCSLPFRRHAPVARMAGLFGSDFLFLHVRRNGMPLGCGGEKATRTPGARGTGSDRFVSHKDTDWIRVLRRFGRCLDLAAPESEISFHPMVNIDPSDRRRISDYLELRNHGRSCFPTVWGQVLSTLQESDAHSLIYFIRRFSSYPLRLVWDLMPISAIVLYCLWSRRLSFASLRRNSFLIALLTVAINLLPYWFLLEVARATSYRSIRFLPCT